MNKQTEVYKEVSLETNTKKDQRVVFDESRGAWFVVSTLVLGWLAVLIVMANGGHGLW
jgi:hypothetical protein